jgi:hypothetical protein
MSLTNPPGAPEPRAQHFSVEGVWSALLAPGLAVEEPQIVVHEAYEPDLFAHLADADSRPSKQMRPQQVTVMARSWKGYSRSQRPW